jgi:hypothetical protein
VNGSGCGLWYNQTATQSGWTKPKFDPALSTSSISPAGCAELGGAENLLGLASEPGVEDCAGEDLDPGQQPPLQERPDTTLVAPRR